MGSSSSPHKGLHAHPAGMLTTLYTYVRRVLRIPMEKVTFSELYLADHPVVEVQKFPSYLVNAYHQTIRSRAGCRVDHAYVREIRFMKEKSGLEHEYLLAYVTLDGQPWSVAPVGIIQCERNVNPEHDSTLNHILAVISAPNSSSLSGSSSSSNDIPSSASSPSGPRIPAADRFILYESDQAKALDRRGDKTLYKFEFDGPVAATSLDPSLGPVPFEPPPKPHLRSRSDKSPLTLYELAAAAIVLHAVAPEYILFERQCYWYASMLYYMLGGDAVENQAPSFSVGAIDIPIAYNDTATVPAEEDPAAPVSSASPGGDAGPATVGAVAPMPQAVATLGGKKAKKHGATVTVTSSAGKFLHIFEVVTLKNIRDSYVSQGFGEHFANQVEEVYKQLHDEVKRTLNEVRTASETAAALAAALAAKDKERAAALAAKDEETAAALAAKDEMAAALAAKDKEMAAKDEETAAALAAKDKEMAAVLAALAAKDPALAATALKAVEMERIIAGQGAGPSSVA
ncbi:hypothetical protein C8Q79DRAFT_1119588 [Trametes meyenii]|nr:hypothetical protein C8Q79DRAFT_1119588 [Trametes meyenii]